MIGLKILLIACCVEALGLKLMDNDDLFLNNSKYAGIRRQYAQELAKKLNAPIGEGLYDKELTDIAGLETSYGKDLDHKQLESGIHKGDKAIGAFGIMPNTIRDLANKVKNPESDLGRALSSEIELNDVEALKSMDSEQLHGLLASNPQLQQKIGRLLYLEAVQKRGQDPERNAFAWQMGSNIPANKISQQQLDNSPRILKLRKMLKQSK